VYRFTLLIVAVMLLTSSVAQAASYQKRDGTVVDPILYTWEDTHSYSGNNLEPNANLTNANLTNANLTDANLTDAYLPYANLWAAKLIGANLTGVDLTDATLYGANLSNAILTDATLTDAWLSRATLASATFSTGTTLKDGQTVLQHGFDAASLQTYLEAPWPGISADSASNLNIVPEPASVLLLLTGLLTLARIRFLA
jgi:hypothetical protein